MDEAELLLRIAGEFGEPKGVFQPELCAEETQGVEELDGFGVGHVQQLTEHTRLRISASQFSGELVLDFLRATSHSGEVRLWEKAVV